MLRRAHTAIKERDEEIAQLTRRKSVNEPPPPASEDEGEVDIENDAASTEVRVAASETASTVSRAPSDKLCTLSLEPHALSLHEEEDIQSQRDAPPPPEMDAHRHDIKATLRSVYVRELLLSSLHL